MTRVPRTSSLHRRVLTVGVGVTALALLTQPVEAADTVEPFDTGAIDAELYLGGTGFSGRDVGAAGFSEIVLGCGIVDRVSLVVASLVAAGEGFDATQGWISGGFLGTPIDTDHFDLDLIVIASGGGPGFGEAMVTPGLEVNLDLDPDMRSWGLYGRADFPIAIVAPEAADGISGPTRFAVETTLGSYYTINDAHQLLLEFTMASYPFVASSEKALDIGGIALGYNLTLNDTFELITELNADIPQQHETLALGFMAGLIVTLPVAN